MNGIFRMEGASPGDEAYPANFVNPGHPVQNSVSLRLSVSSVLKAFDLPSSAKRQGGEQRPGRLGVRPGEGVAEGGILAAAELPKIDHILNQ